MLTKRQKQILDYINAQLKKHDVAPSLQEIASHFHLSSVATIHEHLQALEKKGVLTKKPGQARALETRSAKDELVHIPFLGTIAAGFPIEATMQNESIAVARRNLPSLGNIYALKVSGDSMIEENIHDGDVVLVRHQDTAENGQKVVALLDNYGATLKKFYKEKNHIRLQPANASMEPIIVRNGRDIAIQGIVIDVIKTSFEHAWPAPTFTKNTPALIKERNVETFLNQVIEGNCLEVMRNIPSKSIDMILCDLPYGTTQNRWDSIIPLDKLWNIYERIIKDNGVIVLTGQGVFTANLIVSNPKLFKYKITWVKSKPTNFLNAKKQPLRKHEDICVFYKNQPHYVPQMTFGEPYNKGFRKNQLTGSYGDFKTVEVKSNGERYPTDVVYFKTAESEGETFHPTQKPVELGRYLIRTFTKPGDVVLDNTCGSGSFLVSAVLEGRKFVGIEKNEEVYLHKKHRVNYVEVCKNRITKAEAQYKATANKLL